MQDDKDEKKGNDKKIKNEKKTPLWVSIPEFIQETSRHLWKRYGELAGVWIAGIAAFLLFGAFLTNCEKLVIPR